MYWHSVLSLLSVLLTLASSAPVITGFDVAESLIPLVELKADGSVHYPWAKVGDLVQNQRGDFLVSFQDGSGINRLGQISDTGTFRLTDPKGRWWDLKILKWDAPRVASDPSQSGPALRRFAEGERNKYKDTKLVPEQQYVKELDAFLAREGTPELSQYPTPPDTVLQANAQALTQTRGVVGQPGLTTRVRELPGLQGLDTVQLPQRPGSTTWERPRAVSYGEERELAI